METKKTAYIEDVVVLADFARINSNSSRTAFSSASEKFPFERTSSAESTISFMDSMEKYNPEPVNNRIKKPTRIKLPINRVLNFIYPPKHFLQIFTVILSLY
jgi:hypothetical protein